ncbi:MAG: PQQ-dependent sugar dehydrogenase [Chloroflexi bacterium]|nr:PQQ-dependent sugar dehydrogenase [Chloroflexota bacterium]
MLGSLLLAACADVPAPAPATDPTPNVRSSVLRPRVLTAEAATPPVAVDAVSPADFVSVAPGENHTCALRADGRAVCWGVNDHGQLNVPDRARFSSLASGWHFTCGIQTDGRLACWGRNNHRQAEPPVGRFTVIDAGWDHACALNGTDATCWGRDANGRATPPVGVPFTTIGAGAEHSCGLSTSGALVCWGKNDDGRAHSRDGPFRTVAVGIAHTCVVRDDGMPLCQGANEAGQAHPPSTAFTHISAGHDHSCGRQSGGWVTCWGGEPDDSAAGTFAPPGRFTSLSSGWHTSCALDARTDVVCWRSAHTAVDPRHRPHVLLQAVGPESSPVQGPVDVARWPSGGLAIAGRSGAIVRLTPRHRAFPILDLTAVVDADGGEKGLLSLAVDPRFPDDAYIYVYYTRPSPADPRTTVARLSRFPVVDGRAMAHGELVILDIERPTRSELHFGGAIRFGLDDMLYLGVGDAECLTCPQDLTSLHGKIIRIDVRDASAVEPYRIPDDNPWVGRPDIRPEVWAYGLRNPWRMSIDATDGRLWVADVGSVWQEEVTVAGPGDNLGWPRLEGTLCASVEESASLRAHALEGHGNIYDSPCTDIGDVTAPIIEYSHRQGNCAIIGGAVYRGTAIPRLQGTYVFGDFCSGRIWARVTDASDSWRMRTLARIQHLIVSFGVDAEGEMLVLTLDGPIYRLTAASDEAAVPVTRRPLAMFITRR